MLKNLTIKTRLAFVIGLLCLISLAIGLLAKPVPVIPIDTADFPTPARRPHYSVLDKSSTFAALGGPAPHWRANLRIMLSEIKTNG